MKALLNVAPTNEQLTIISKTSFGTELIRGSAGSGKTTTAILRLRSLISAFSMRKRRHNDQTPINALVLTFNRTLRGYIEELTLAQNMPNTNLLLNVSTFSKWAMDALYSPNIIHPKTKKELIIRLGRLIQLESKFLLDEVDYILGRFLPNEINKYVDSVRLGRGASPRVDKNLRLSILEQVIHPYLKYLEDQKYLDWNSLAVQMVRKVPSEKYDFIITDETQDFSANQLRAISSHLKDEHCLTVVLDTAQKVYARGFSWQEVGITVKPENSKRLSENYRNTEEIVEFSRSFVQGLSLDNDATISPKGSCQRTGEKPKVIQGAFNNQFRYIISELKKIDLLNETVAILHPLGGGWFDRTKQLLNANRLNYVEITKESTWPKGPENIILSTMHSSKGLEFDHVFIIGLMGETLNHGIDENDDRLDMLRRLLAMSITRARDSVLLTFNPNDPTPLYDFLIEGTYEEIVL